MYFLSKFLVNKILIDNHKTPSIGTRYLGINKGYKIIERINQKYVLKQLV